MANYQGSVDSHEADVHMDQANPLLALNGQEHIESVAPTSQACIGDGSDESSKTSQSDVTGVDIVDMDTNSSPAHQNEGHPAVTSMVTGDNEMASTGHGLQQAEGTTANSDSHSPARHREDGVAHSLACHQENVVTHSEEDQMRRILSSPITKNHSLSLDVQLSSSGGGITDHAQSLATIQQQNSDSQTQNANPFSAMIRSIMTGLEENVQLDQNTQPVQNDQQQMQDNVQNDQGQENSKTTAAKVNGQAHDQTQKQDQLQEGEERGWLTDSSSHKSSDESSLDSDSDSDSESDMNHPTLEQMHREIAQRLDDDDDDEGGTATGSSNNNPHRSKHELPEPILPIPDMELEAQEPIVRFGRISAIISEQDCVVVVIQEERMLASRDRSVLDQGCLLCLENRQVIGVVHETLGTVMFTLYTIRYVDMDQVKEFGLKVDTNIFIPPAKAATVFTQALRANRHTDASNNYDEEIASGDEDFSDDEKEAAFKRATRERRQGAKGRGDRGRGGRGGRADRHVRGGRNQGPALREPGNLKYEDDDDSTSRPLARSSRFATTLPRRPDVQLPRIEEAASAHHAAGTYDFSLQARGTASWGGRGGHQGRGPEPGPAQQQFLPPPDVLARMGIAPPPPPMPFGYQSWPQSQNHAWSPAPLPPALYNEEYRRMNEASRSGHS